MEILNDYHVSQFLNRVKRGVEINYIIHSVSRSGMSRTMSFYTAVLSKDNKPEILNITRAISILSGMRMNKDNSLVVKGCGMDMVFHVLNSASSAIKRLHDKGLIDEPIELDANYYQL